MDDHNHTPRWWDNFWTDPKRNFGEPREQLLNLVDEYRQKQAQLQTRCSLVDIGSGNGRYAIPFAKRGYDTVVIEMSSEACGLINRRCQAEGVFVAVINKDVLHAPNTQYDIVFSSGLIEEILPKQQAEAVNKIKQLVKPNGLLVLKYCLEIAQRGITVAEKSVTDMFIEDTNWQIIEMKTDPAMRDSIATIDFENRVRTETIIAVKKSEYKN